MGDTKRHKADFGLASKGIPSIAIYITANGGLDIEYGRVAQLVAHLFSILTTVRHLVYRRSRVQFPARPIFLGFFGLVVFCRSIVAFGLPIAERCMHRVERDVRNRKSTKSRCATFAGTTGSLYYSRWIAVGGSPL
jgi:hypothetical protein